METAVHQQKAEKAEDGSAYNKAEQLLEEKMSASKDGTIYLDDTDMKTIIEAARKEDEPVSSNGGNLTVLDWFRSISLKKEVLSIIHKPITIFLKTS